MKEDNLILRVLKFATAKGEFTFSELCDEISPDDVEKEQLKLQIHYKDILCHNNDNFIHQVDTKEIKLFAKVEDHFRLLKYQELKEARKSSALATTFASAALVVSIVATVCSIFFSYSTQKSDINIPDKLYSVLANASKNDDKRNKDLLKKIGEYSVNKNDIALIKEIVNQLSKIEANTSIQSFQGTSWNDFLFNYREREKINIQSEP
nr:hypothetical protein [uncultured Desulfobacter sp.]